MVTKIGIGLAIILSLVMIMVMIVPTMAQNSGTSNGLAAPGNAPSCCGTTSNGAVPSCCTPSGGTVSQSSAIGGSCCGR